MELKNCDLKVFYNLNGNINQDLDQALEKALKKKGFRRWGSGIEIDSGIRNIAFERKTPEN